MSSSVYSLRSDLIAEPLLNNWYAWGTLISPTTYCKYLQHHIKLLKSYLQAPHIHQQANTEVRLRGGTFLDLGNTAQLIKVNDLLNYTLSHCADLITLSENIDKLNELLKKYKNEPINFENLYHNLPDELRGLIELVYDLNNNPAVRFIEPIFYNSSYYKPELQSVLLYCHNPDKRPFVLSTPRLALRDSVQLSLSFNSQFYDSLFQTRQVPISLTMLQELYTEYLLKSKLDFEKFKSFFKEKKPINSNKKEFDDCSIKYFGHACVLIQTPSCNILIDPLISYENPDSSLSRLSFPDLPDQIDYVLLTHLHQDHTVLETLLQIRYKIKNIIVPQNNKGALQDPSLKLILQHCGFKNVYEMSEFDSIKIHNGKITALPFFGEHADLDIRSKASYLVTINNKSVLFLADSKNLDPHLYIRMAQFLPSIDIIFIGLESEGAPLSWLYGPLMLSGLTRTEDRSRRLNGSNAEEGFSIIKALNCREVYIYAMAYEPWLTFISNLNYDTSTKQIKEAKKLINLCEKENIKSELLYGSKLINF